MNALYCYFGELGIFYDDIPGHNLYQLGLIDELGRLFQIEKFDFLNYIQPQKQNVYELTSESNLSLVHKTFYYKLIDNYNILLADAITNIITGNYSTLFLKARFRNLSTLANNYNDTTVFEQLITTAIDSGMSRTSIIVLDTDMSMPIEFKNKLQQLGIPILIPSIDIKGVSDEFLLKTSKASFTDFYKKSKTFTFYGNLDFTNYTAGNTKNNIIHSCLTSLATSSYIDKYNLYNIEPTIPIVISKYSKNDCPNTFTQIPRTNREAIWNALTSSMFNINVTKDKYADAHFIPARIYEALMFHQIPISYNYDFINKAMSFHNITDFENIVKYLLTTDIHNIVTLHEQILATVIKLNTKIVNPIVSPFILTK